MPGEISRLARRGLVNSPTARSSRLLWPDPSPASFSLFHLVGVGLGTGWGPKLRPLPPFPAVGPDSDRIELRKLEFFPDFPDLAGPRGAAFTPKTGYF